MEDKIDFLEIHKGVITNEFWNENYKKVIMKQIENQYKKEITDHWGICDMITNGDKVLLQWYKKINH